MKKLIQRLSKWADNKFLLAEYEATERTPEQIEILKLDFTSLARYQGDVVREVRDLRIENNSLKHMYGYAQERLTAYESAGLEPLEITELQRKCSDDEHEFCGEYGTDECQFSHKLKKLQQERDDAVKQLENIKYQLTHMFGEGKT